MEKLKLQMIMQGDRIVSAFSNQIPVIELVLPKFAAVTAVNFLRCGCPHVQIVFDKFDVSGIKNFKEALRLLEIEGEVFDGIERIKDEFGVLTLNRSTT